MCLKIVIENQVEDAKFAQEKLKYIFSMCVSSSLDTFSIYWDPP